MQARSGSHRTYYKLAFTSLDLQRTEYSCKTKYRSFILCIAANIKGYAATQRVHEKTSASGSIQGQKFLRRQEAIMLLLSNKGGFMVHNINRLYHTNNLLKN
jgi:hypothetical protein